MSEARSYLTVRRSFQMNRMILRGSSFVALWLIKWKLLHKYYNLYLYLSSVSLLLVCFVAGSGFQSSDYIKAVSHTWEASAWGNWTFININSWFPPNKKKKKHLQKCQIMLKGIPVFLNVYLHTVCWCINESSSTRCRRERIYLSPAEYLADFNNPDEATTATAHLSRLQSETFFSGFHSEDLSL